jgi:transposase-like protein
MSNKYSKEFRESIILRMLPPKNAQVVDLAQETGIPKDTLYTWKSKYCKRKGALSSSAQTKAEIQQ